MQAFRAAFRDRDSEKALDIRSEANERVISGRRTTPRSAVSESVLRQELAEDLSALLNTVNLNSAENLDGLEEVQHSIINYGVDDLTAISVDSRHVGKITPRLLDVLESFEARLVEGSVHVKSEIVTDDVNTRIAVHINADMYATPSDVPIEFVADFEAYDGKVRVKQS